MVVAVPEAALYALPEAGRGCVHTMTLYVVRHWRAHYPNYSSLWYWDLLYQAWSVEG